MPFTKHAVETFISAKITAITECRIADLDAEFPAAKDWVSAFGLRVMFNDQPPEKMRPFTLQFIRRVEMALSEYSAARMQIQDLIPGNPRWSPYYRALHHMEVAVALLYQAYDVGRKATDKDYFEKGDGSPLQRLNRIYNSSKHIRAIADGPVWLSNQGVCTADTVLLFSEFEGLAREAARIVEGILNGVA
jgi:hypothetical protein